VAATNTHQWKRGDTLPALRRTLKYSNGQVQPLAGATVTFIMYPSDGGRPAAGASPITGDVDIIDANAGVVEFVPITETATAGIYLGELRVVTVDSRRVTFPNDGYITITILDDLGDQ
jgi:hypothetical protein